MFSEKNFEDIITELKSKPIWDEASKKYTKTFFLFLHELFKKAITHEPETYLVLLDRSWRLIEPIYLRNRLTDPKKVIIDQNEIVSILHEFSCKNLILVHNDVHETRSPIKVNINIKHSLYVNFDEFIRDASKKIGCRHHDHLILTKNRIYSLSIKDGLIQESSCHPLPFLE